MHWYWENVGKDNYKLFFVIFQLSYGPWLMSEFYFHLISWELIDGFWWNFMYAVLWLTHENFPNFSTELWSLIDVKISQFFSISSEIIHELWRCLQWRNAWLYSVLFDVAPCYWKSLCKIPRAQNSWRYESVVLTNRIAGKRMNIKEIKL